MDKDKWISDKISKLISEGKNINQASAIAFSMYENIKENGGYHLPEFQTGGMGSNVLNPLGTPQVNSNVNNIPQGYGMIPQQFNSMGALPNTPTLWQQPVVNSPQSNLPQTVEQNQSPEAVSQSSTQRRSINPVSSLSPAGTTYGTTEEQLQASVQGVLPDMTQSTNTQDTTQQSINYKPNEKIQFFNPYGGFDIPTAASFLGASVENKDALGIAGSGLKLATGLARNFFGGMGLQNRNNQVMKDYYEKQKNDLTRTEVLQEGGNFINPYPGNMFDIGVDSTNMFPQFTEGSVPPEGEITPFTNVLQSPYQAPEVPLKNQPYDIYQNGGNKEPKTLEDFKRKYPKAEKRFTRPDDGTENWAVDGNAQYTSFTYHPPSKPLEKRNNDIKSINKLNPEDLKEINPNSKFSEAKILNQYIQPKFWDVQDNVNQNFGSTQTNYRVNPQTGDSMLRTLAPEPYNSRVSTAYYQDGGVQQQEQMQGIEQQIVESLQQGIEPQVIVQNLVEQGMPEQEVVQMVQQIIQQTQSQNQPEQAFMQNGGKMSLAKGLTGEYMTGMDKDNPIQQPNAEIENGEYVQHPTGELQKAVGDTHEKGGIDVKLQDNTKILSDHLKPKIDFVRKIKKDYEIEVKSSDTYSKILDKYSRKIGLTKVVEDQESLIKKMEKVVKTNKDEESLGLNTQYLSEELKKLEDKKKPLETDRKNLFEKLFEEQEDSKPKEDSNKSYQNGGNHFSDGFLKLAQKYNIPEEELMNTFQKGGIKLPQYQNGKNQNRFDDRYNDLVALGYNGSKNVGEMQSWMNANYPDDVVKYFTETNQPMTAKHVDIVKDKYRDAFNKAGIPSNKDSAKYTEEEKSKLKEALGANATKDFWLEGFNDNKQDWRFPIISGVPSLPARNSIEEQITAPGLPNLYQPTFVANTPIINETEEEKAKRNLNLLLLPDQSPMLPGSLQPHLKINRRFDRVNPALISPEQALQEINKQTVATKERLNLGAGAERIAGELGLSANTQDNINKIVTDTEKLNSQIISNTDARNATIQATEENAAAQDALSYEQRQLTAKAKTDFDINNYYNTLRENNVRNYSKVNDLNLLNQMYNDFQFNGSTIEKNSPNIQFSSNNPIYKADTTPTKKKKKQDGGRFKK